MAILKDKAYESAYAGTIDELVNKAVNREAFSYDPATDQAYQAYAKEYGRLGKQAREDTLGDVANNTGGLVSSYATTAAAQAQNQYNQALTDKIPALMEAAYARYNDDFNNNLNMIGVLKGLDETEYGRFADQRTYDRNVFEADRNYNYQVGRDAVADNQWNMQFDYQKDRDAVADSQWQTEFDYNKHRDDVSDAQWREEFDWTKTTDQRDYDRDVYESDRDYDYQVERDKESDRQWQAEFDLDVRAQEYEEKYNDEQAKYEKMLTSWQTLGYATKEVAEYFGVPEGTQTSDYKFTAAELALEQSKAASGGSSGSGGGSGSGSGSGSGGGSGDGGGFTEKDYTDIRNLEFRQFQSTYITSDTTASQKQKDEANRMAENFAQAGSRMTTDEITDSILEAAGLDENGNSIKGAKKNITKNQAQYLMIRFGGY